MIQKNFWLGILAMMLIFTMAVVGCDNGHNPSPSPSPSTGDSINGIWVSSDSVDPELFTLDNGNFEHFLGSSLTTKGTYTLDGNNISLTTTHVHGDMLNEVESFELIVEESFESKWYPAADIQPLLQALLQELQASLQNFQDLYGDSISEDWMQAMNEELQGIQENFDKMFSTQTFAYSVNGDTLTLTFDGESTAFTRKSGNGDTPGTDNSINGTWVLSDSVDPVSITLDNGRFENFLGSSPIMKGTYTLDGNNISLTTTHVHGNMLKEFGEDFGGIDESFESKWYPAADIQPLLQASWQNFQDLYGGYISEDEMQAINEMMQGYFDKMFSTQTFAYSVNGDTLTLTFDGESTAFTRK